MAERSDSHNSVSTKKKNICTPMLISKPLSRMKIQKAVSIDSLK
jgi:hypothetical protein